MYVLCGTLLGVLFVVGRSVVVQGLLLLFFCLGVLVLGVELNAVVGDCKCVGELDICDLVALEVVEGLNVN